MNTPAGSVTSKALSVIGKGKKKRQSVMQAINPLLAAHKFS